MHAERLKRLYGAMLKCRELDAVRGETQGHASGHGLEAIISGVAIHLRAEDFVAPSPYEHLIRSIQGASLQPGGSISTQAEHKNGGPTEASHQLYLATGIALACKLMERSCVTLCLSNMAQGADFWRPAVTFAANRKLPIVFVLSHAPEESLGAFSELRNQAQQLLPAITVDGNDVVGVYRVAEESTRRARQGLGPSLIECRLEAGRDPLIFMEAYLKSRDLWSDKLETRADAKLEHDLTRTQKARAKAV